MTEFEIDEEYAKAYYKLPVGTKCIARATGGMVVVVVEVEGLSIDGELVWKPFKEDV